MEKKLKITNVAQFESLVRELEKNPSLAKGFTRGTVPANFKKKWYEISKQLNSLGPPKRDSDGWQKVWRDFKFKVKKKMSLNKAACNATGDKPHKQLPLSPLEVAVANLVQFDKQLRSDELMLEVPEHEFVVQELEEEIRVTPNASEPYEFLIKEEQFTQKNSSPNDEQWLLEDIQIEENICAPDVFHAIEKPSSSINEHLRVKTSARKKTKKSRNTNTTNQDYLLEMYNNIEVFNEISRTMVAIKNTLKDTRRIEEEKLNLLKRRNEREEQLFQKEMEIKQIELEIKRKKLQMITNDKYSKESETNHMAGLIKLEP